MSSKAKPFLVLFGPTASGKSELAMCLARALNATVINADSRQIFADLPILSACPSRKDYTTVPHELYETLSWSQSPLNAHDWAVKAAHCLQNTSLGIVTGGTGFYINTLIKGISPIPPIHPSVLTCVQKLCRHTLSQRFFYTLLKLWDANITFHKNNSEALQKALCIAAQTRKKPSSWKLVPPKRFTHHKAFIIKIMPPKIDLDAIILRRAQAMFSAGVMAEIEHFFKNHTAAPQALGFNIIAECTRNAITQDKALELLVYATRQYAKRQLSFGKHHIEEHLTWPCIFESQHREAFMEKFFPLWRKHCRAVEEN